MNFNVFNTYVIFIFLTSTFHSAVINMTVTLSHALAVPELNIKLTQQEL